MLSIAYSMLLTVATLVHGMSAVSDPNQRVRELINSRDDFTDQPSHMTPERVHGGIQ